MNFRLEGRIDMSKTTLWMMATNGIIASVVWLTLILLIVGVV